jgi:urease accessory protein
MAMVRTAMVRRMTDPRALVRLLQLASPALPVGAFSYSQGLEAGIEAGLVRDAATLQAWLDDALQCGLAGMELPLLQRLHACWSVALDTGRDPASNPAPDTVDQACIARAQHWNDSLLCTRESAELRAEALQMGYSLRELLRALLQDSAVNAMDGAEGQRHRRALHGLQSLQSPAFATVYALAASVWGIGLRQAMTAYVWSWLENQVMAAIKAVPLGQTDGQRVLLRMGGGLDAVIDKVLDSAAQDMTNFLPGLAILASQHETQYSRLFRS